MTESNILFEKTIEVRWADCDANQHMRHSAYADLCAHTRICFMDSIGMTADWQRSLGLGPVLFRDETEYLREAYINDVITITVEVGEPTGFSKSIQIKQNMYKNERTLIAKHSCVVGFMDLRARKAVALPEPFAARFPVVISPKD